MVRLSCSILAFIKRLFYLKFFISLICKRQQAYCPILQNYLTYLRFPWKFSSFEKEYSLLLEKVSSQSKSSFGVSYKELQKYVTSLYKQSSNHPLYHTKPFCLRELSPSFSLVKLITKWQEANEHFFPIWYLQQTNEETRRAFAERYK